MPKQITVEVSDTVYALLEVLARGQVVGDEPSTETVARVLAEDRLGSFGVAVEDVVLALIDHAQQGVYRPGSWERGWLHSAFGDCWEIFLEPGDPYGRDDEQSRRLFQRPRRSAEDRYGTSSRRHPRRRTT